MFTLDRVSFVTVGLGIGLVLGGCASPTDEAADVEPTGEASPGAAEKVAAGIEEGTAEEEGKAQKEEEGKAQKEEATEQEEGAAGPQEMQQPGAAEGMQKPGEQATPPESPAAVHPPEGVVDSTSQKVIIGGVFPGYGLGWGAPGFYGFRGAVGYPGFYGYRGVYGFPGFYGGLYRSVGWGGALGCSAFGCAPGMWW